MKTNKLTNHLNGRIFALIFSLLLITHAWADDIDIFSFADPNEAQTTHNLMFILDNSGSMKECLDTALQAGSCNQGVQKRFESLRDTFINTIQNAPNNLRIGVMQYNTPGATVMYPLRDINAHAEPFKGPSSTPNTPISVTAKLADYSDQARENSQGRITAVVNEPTLLGCANAFDCPQQAFRFVNVNIPKGAIIDSAYLEGKVPNTGSVIIQNLASLVLTIQAQNTANASAITTNSKNISSRIMKTASVSWSFADQQIPNPSTSFYIRSPEVKDLIADIIQDSNDQYQWDKTNNALLFKITNGNANTSSYIRTFSFNSPVSTMSLYVKYHTPPPSSAPITQTFSLGNNTDDATENSVGAYSQPDKPVLGKVGATVKGYVQGFRFPNVTVPRNATITSATLTATQAFQSAGPAPELRLDITAESSANAAALPAEGPNTNSSISNRPFFDLSNFTPVVWTMPNTVASDGTLTTADSNTTTALTALVQRVVCQANWQSNNALLFKITHHSHVNVSSMQIIGREADSNKAMKLTVTYDTSNPAVCDDQDYRVREYVIDLVRARYSSTAMQWVDGTPIAESMYEAAQYFSGGEVFFGSAREKYEILTNPNRISGTEPQTVPNKRLSHPSSYTGGLSPEYRPSGCNSRDANSSACLGETISSSYLTNSTTKPDGYSPPATSPKYIAPAPIAGTCNTNNIIFLTDGVSTDNQTSIEDLTQRLTSNSCVESGESKNLCSKNIAKWLFSNYRVKTHTIGYTDDSNALGFLSELSSDTYGHGTSASASSSTDLSNAFTGIFGTLQRPQQVTSKAIGGSANALAADGTLLYTLFVANPPFTRWSGNLKKYTLGKGFGNYSNDLTVAIRDKNGKPAINSTTGEFYTDTQSYWSSTNDGSRIDKGGAAEQLAKRDPITNPRVILTNDGTTSTLNSLNENNNSITSTTLGISSSDMSTTRSDLLKWARGLDVQDTDADKNTSEMRSSDLIFDVVHSTPTIINFGTATNPNQYAFFGTNAGYLHAINLQDGSEKFAFVPEEFLPNLYKYYKNDLIEKLSSNIGSHHVYGIDGSPMNWSGSDGTKYLAFGTGAGRKNPDSNPHGIYYCLRVGGKTNIETPTLQWRITGGTTTGFEELGQTWSTPVKTKINVNNTTKDVLIFGGGNSTHFDTNNESASLPSGESKPLGNAIYIIDATTGALLWKVAGNNTSPNLSLSNMKYPIPSDIAIWDNDGDGRVDQFFVGDLGGQIWRFDVKSNAATLTAAITGGVIAKLGNPSPTPTPEIAQTDISGKKTITDAGTKNWDRRVFFNTPTVTKAVSTDPSGAHEFLILTIGSGNKIRPIETYDNEEMTDKFYALTTQLTTSNTYTAVQEASLQNLTTASDYPANYKLSYDAKGWYIKMNPREKVLAKSLIYNNSVYFNTYQSGLIQDQQCARVVGTAKSYTVDLYTAAASLDLNHNGSKEAIADRSNTLVTTTIATETSIVPDSSGTLTTVNDAHNAQAISLTQPPPNSDKWYKTYFYERPDSGS